MIDKGTLVKWKNGEIVETGKVKSIFGGELAQIEDSISAKSAPIRSLYIEQENGSHVLKLESEVEKV